MSALKEVPPFEKVLEWATNFSSDTKSRNLRNPAFSVLIIVAVIVIILLFIWWLVSIWTSKKSEDSESDSEESVEESDSSTDDDDGPSNIINEMRSHSETTLPITEMEKHDQTPRGPPRPDPIMETKLQPPVQTLPLPALQAPEVKLRSLPAPLGQTILAPQAPPIRSKAPPVKKQ